jgi:predicted N-acetyltransferase YhbS
MIIRIETAGDDDEIRRLTRLGFGKNHPSRNIWHLREGPAVKDLCLVAQDKAGDDTQNNTQNNTRDGDLLGSIRFWPITLAGLPSVLLGPLAVDPDLRGQGYGKALIKEGLRRAKAGPWAFCFVSGEPEYYVRLGFSKISAGDVDLPAPIEDERLHLISVSGNAIGELPAPPWVIRPAPSK